MHPPSYAGRTLEQGSDPALTRGLVGDVRAGGGLASDRTGLVLALSNPVHLLRERPAGGYPARPAG